MFPDQFLAMKNMPRKFEESLLMLLLTCASHVIPVHMACTHHMRFLARDLCAFYVVLMHMACVILVYFPYIQDFSPDDSSLYLGTEMVKISRVEISVFSLD